MTPPRPLGVSTDIPDEVHEVRGVTPDVSQNRNHNAVASELLTLGGERPLAVEQTIAQRELRSSKDVLPGAGVGYTSQRPDRQSIGNTVKLQRVGIVVCTLGGFEQQLNAQNRRECGRHVVHPFDGATCSFDLLQRIEYAGLFLGVKGQILHELLVSGEYGQLQRLGAIGQHDFLVEHNIARR